jgi:hypothetical protein
MHVLDVRRGHRKLVIMVETDVDVTAAFAWPQRHRTVEVSATSCDIGSRAGDRSSTTLCTSWRSLTLPATPLAPTTDPNARRRDHKEALRCLRRRLSDVVYRQLVHDAATEVAAGWRTTGAAVESSGRLTPLHRHFGSVTTRPATTDATSNKINLTREEPLAR